MIPSKLYSENIKNELGFWNHFFHIATTDSGSYFKKYLDRRLDLGLPLHSLPASVLDNNKDEYYILDVGSGPLPFLGRVLKDKKIDLVAIDLLADEYSKLYKKYNIYPPTIPIQGSAGELGNIFTSTKFDLVYARNSIDHTQDPRKCIQEMVGVSKGYVLLEHKVNEGKVEKYEGLHQWNFFCENGKFFIGSRSGDIICVNDEINVASLECYVTIEEEEKIEDWLVVKIKV